MNEKKSAAGGCSIGTTLLQVVFIVLKLCGVIDWSWWWVLSPTWISIALAVLLIVIGFILLAIVKLFE